MLPYLDDRPVNLHRFPDGIDQAGLLAQGRALARARVAHAVAQQGGRSGRDRGVPRRRLAGVARMGRELRRRSRCTLDLHRAKTPHKPTWAMIDIDPGEDTSFDDVVLARRLHRTAMEHLGADGHAEGHAASAACRSGCRSKSGTRSIRRGRGSRSSRATDRDTVPDLVSWEWEVSKRSGKLRLDYTQNAINKTLVAPFSPRPAHGAPVSVPITWDELDDPDLGPTAGTSTPSASGWPAQATRWRRSSD